MVAIFFMAELDGTEWMGMLCMNQRKVQTIFFGPRTHASVKNRTISEQNEIFIQIYRSILLWQSQVDFSGGVIGRWEMANSLKPAWLTRAVDVDLPGGYCPACWLTRSPAQQVRGGARTTTLSQRLNGNPRAWGKTANSLPEVKWEKGPPELPPLSGFLPFFVTCHAMSRNMCIFYPGGLTYERGGGVCRKFWIKPLKETNLGVGRPLKETILFQCSLVINVIDNFDHINWVYKTNWLNIYLRVQPNKRP